MGTFVRSMQEYHSTKLVSGTIRNPYCLTYEQDFVSDIIALLEIAILSVYHMFVKQNQLFICQKLLQCTCSCVVSLYKSYYLFMSGFPS